MSIALTSRSFVGAEDRTARLVRSALFMAALLLFWVGVDPFHDLTIAALPGSGETSNTANQLAMSAVAVAAIIFILRDGWRRFAVLLSAPLLATVAAIGVSAILSAHPALSLRRFVLAMMIMAIAAACLKLPRDRRHFADLLAAVAAIVLAACYCGLLLLPDLAIHHAGEALEPEHAGGWRGLFVHKNQAGAAMVVLVFIGFFVARVRSILVGGAIIGFSVFFLANTGAKAPMGLLPVVVALSLAVLWIPYTSLRLALVVGSVALLNLLTVGSAVFAPIRSLAAAVVSDPTFTNRDDIWRFALDNAVNRPLFGHGFEAFWRTSSLVYSGSAIETWAATTSDAHNAYLNLMVNAGLAALIPATIWLLIQPLRDLRRSEARANDPALAALFIQIWLFGLLLGGLESTFFAGGGPVWFSILIAVFGLRFHATSPVRR